MLNFVAERNQPAFSEGGTCGNEAGGPFCLPCLRKSLVIRLDWILCMVAGALHVEIFGALGTMSHNFTLISAQVKANGLGTTDLFWKHFFGGEVGCIGNKFGGLSLRKWQPLWIVKRVENETFWRVHLKDILFERLTRKSRRQPDSFWFLPVLCKLNFHTYEEIRRRKSQSQRHGTNGSE